MEDLAGSRGFPVKSNENSNSNETKDAEAGKFIIPALRPKTSSCANLKLVGLSQTDNKPSNINQFLLKQLEPHNSNDRFNVPKLKGSSTGFVIPELKGGLMELPNVSSSMNGAVILEQNINLEGEQKLQGDEVNDHIIDLTTALSSAKIVDSAHKINRCQKPQLEHFEIPFIDCDRQNQLLQTDDYCIIDISEVIFQHNLAPPSTLGRLLSNKTRRKQSLELPKKEIVESRAKHRIERFLFDTKSPDDIVLASLNRFTRTQ